MALWKVIAHHDDPASAINRAVADGVIAVGWGRIGDLRQDPPTDSSAVTQRIRSVYPDHANAHLGGPSLWNLYAGMSVGDLVILRGGGETGRVLEITGDYRWVSPCDAIGDYQHQRRAVATDDDPEELWVHAGREVAPGDNARWPVARCEGTVAPTKGPRRFLEGTRFDIVATGIERNPDARREAMRVHGVRCIACDFDFESVYGEIGRGFIHVHHRRPLSQAEESREVDPRADLVPLCPNCHAMVHRAMPPLAIEDLISRLRR